MHALLCLLDSISGMDLRGLSSQFVMNTTRTVFGKHQQGHIFPMLLNVKAMETSFAGIMQELTTTDQFVMFLSKSFVVLEATHESLKLMGVRTQLL
jgi:hypothetical protein